MSRGSEDSLQHHGTAAESGHSANPATGTRLIVMLTRDDVTIPDALDRIDDVLSSSAGCVGCKDLGMDEAGLAQLIERARAAGRETFVEVVSPDERGALAAADVALRVRPDYLIGGNVVAPVVERLAGSGVSFMPYVGDVYDHPCRLRGAPADVAAHAAAALAAGAAGVNLLAYRYDGDPLELTHAVRERIDAPIVSAGSIDSPERLRAMADLSIDYVTIGTALLDGRFVDGGSFKDQIDAAEEVLRRSAGGPAPKEVA